MSKKTYSGFTEETAESLLLDAGAFFKNFLPGVDTFTTAVSAGKLLGATKDGGEFAATPAIRQIEVDGVKGKAKGLEILDSWEVYIKANVLEVKKETLEAALCASNVDSEIMDTHNVITAKNSIDLTDYIDNVTWVGTLSGSDEPVIIQVYNALNTDGLKLVIKDKDQAVIAMTFFGHYTQTDLDTPPFKIFYPKKIKVTPVTSSFSIAAPANKEFTVIGSAVTKVAIGTTDLTVTTDYTIANGVVTIKKEKLATFTAGKYTVTFTTSIGDGFAGITITA